MKIADLGTGMVGDVIGSRLVELGHDVKMEAARQITKKRRPLAR